MEGQLCSLGPCDYLGFESSTAYNNRGLSLDDRGQPEAARADFEKAIALDPRNYFAYNNQGVLYGKDGQYERSIDYFQRAIAINARHADSYCNLGCPISMCIGMTLRWNSMTRPLT